MSLMDQLGGQLGGMLRQYAGGGPADQSQAVDHFDQVAQQAPQSSLAGALTQIFQSPQTGTFGQNIGSLFGQSNPDQRAGIINRLLPSLGAAGLGSLAGMFGSSLFGGGSNSSGAAGAPQISPDLAQQIPPEAVEQLATHAQQQNPSIVEQASNFYAQHPTLVKALGAGAAIMALRHMASVNQ